VTHPFDAHHFYSEFGTQSAMNVYNEEVSHKAVKAPTAGMRPPRDGKLWAFPLNLVK
jgi:hypothetical protein